MQINADLNASAYSIKSYEVGEVTIFEPISKEEVIRPSDGYDPQRWMD